MNELELLLQDAKEEAKQNRKECWRDDIDEKAFYDGEISAYSYALSMIKKIQSEQNGK